MHVFCWQYNTTFRRLYRRSVAFWCLYQKAADRMHISLNTYLSQHKSGGSHIHHAQEPLFWLLDSSVHKVSYKSLPTRVCEYQAPYPLPACTLG